MAETNVTNMPYRPSNVNHNIQRDFTKDYVVVDGYTVGQQKVLSQTEDELENEISLELYERMENDATIAKSKRILITSVLSDDVQLAPGATEDQVGAKEYEVYVAIMEFCQRCVSGLDKPLRDTLEQILGNGIRYGHGIGEIEWDYKLDGESTKPVDKTPQKKSRLGAMWAKFGFSYGAKAEEPTPEGQGVKRPALKSNTLRLMPTSVKVKPRGAAKFVVDNYMNVIGLAPKYRYYGSESLLKYNEIVDRRKFMVLTLQKTDEDPRGKSCYRPAFNWYNLKTQTPQEMLRYILEESVPKAVGTLPPNSTPFEFERDENNNIIYDDPGTNKQPRMLTAAESFSRQIKGLRSGSGAVIPNGATLQPYKRQGSTDADIFSKILKIVDDQMENAILLQTLAQSEGEHQARSAAQQVAELLYNLTFWLRWLIAMMLLSDLLTTAVQLNFGDWALRYLPQVSLGDFVRRNWTEELKAYADAYFKGLLDDTQRPEIMANLNMPKPGPSRQELMQEQIASQDVNGEAVPNPNNRNDKKGGDRNKGNGTEKKKDEQRQNANTGLGTSNSLGHNKGWFRRN